MSTTTSYKATPQQRGPNTRPHDEIPHRFHLRFSDDGGSQECISKDQAMNATRNLSVHLMLGSGAVAFPCHVAAVELVEACAV
eukprot:6472405-Amphidinium_carterae.2